MHVVPTVSFTDFFPSLLKNTKNPTCKNVSNLDNTHL